MSRPAWAAPDPAMRQRLRACVDHLAGRIGPRHMQHQRAWARTVAYLERELASASGRRVHRERYATEHGDAENLYVQWPGRGPTLIVAAHYDTLAQSPGADDNASAVAALLEIARHLRTLHPRRRVRLIALANEEHPHFARGTMGSQIHARACKARGEALEMIALEMLGYFQPDRPQRYPWPLGYGRGWLLPRYADFIGMVANVRSAGLLTRLRWTWPRRSAVPAVACALPETRLIRRSDHAPFWDCGYRAVMLTDTSFLRNPHYHQPTDLPDTLDDDRLAMLSGALSHAIARCVGAG